MSNLDYPFTQVPDIATGVEITSGIHWLKLPLPIALDHINVWLLDDGDGWTLIDTGIAIDATRQAWEQLNKHILMGRPINRIVVTHHHPDHFGLARWLSKKFNCHTTMSSASLEKVDTLLREDISDIRDSVDEFYRSNGIDDTGMFVEFDTGRKYRNVVSGIPENITIIMIGGRSWRTIFADGHAEGHISLYSDALKMLISGDQILPAISSNVSLYASSADSNPLQDYLDSLVRFSRLPESTLVLPSHGMVFRGLHLRIEELQADHKDKLDRVVSFCREPGTVADIVELLFTRKLDDLNRLLAFGETLAHLRYLERQKRLRRTVKQGKNYYQCRD